MVDETIGSETTENEVKIENNKKLEIKESDDITNSLFGKCGNCQKPRPGMFACPGSMDDTAWLSTFLSKKKNPYETFNLGGLFCDSCQSIVIAVFEKAGWYKMDTIKRHVVSKRHKKATASYTVKITGPDFFIKTERKAKSSWNIWNISLTQFENSVCQNSY